MSYAWLFKSVTVAAQQDTTHTIVPKLGMNHMLVNLEHSGDAFGVLQFVA